MMEINIGLKRIQLRLERRDFGLKIRDLDRHVDIWRRIGDLQ